MNGKQVVIYRAGTAEEAHVLKNLLAEAGIRAEVTNDVLAGGAGTDILGWPSLAKVIVNQDDEPTARSMAIEFDRQASQNNEVDELSPAELPDDWPTCPQCSRRRTTACPFCGTSGDHFQPADRIPEEAEEEENDDSLLLCSTCDEPFSPHYLPVCEWCSHRFEADASQSEGAISLAKPTDGMNSRVIVVLIVTIGSIVAAAAYFVRLFR